jgi:hypothetical protein
VAWKAFPVATFEGQYILKNMVLVAGAMVLGGATVAERRRPPVARRSEACGSTSGSPRRFCSCVGAGR